MTTLTTNQQNDQQVEQNGAKRGDHQSETTFVPRFDLWEGDQEMQLYGDLPGVSPENLDIRFENGHLIVHGKVDHRYENIEFHYGEYGIGDFYRTFALGDTIDVENISAEMRHGVLTIHLPKSEKVQPRKIEVKVA